jgi:hypothetical protein
VNPDTLRLRCLLAISLLIIFVMAIGCLVGVGVFSLPGGKVHGTEGISLRVPGQLSSVSLGDLKNGCESATDRSNITSEGSKYENSSCS